MVMVLGMLVVGDMFKVVLNMGGMNDGSNVFVLLKFVNLKVFGNGLIMLMGVYVNYVNGIGNMVS